MSTWLRFSLEYCHPRLYKFEDKRIVDARFDSLANSIKDSISGLDLLSKVSAINATVRCGHLYTIPQGALEKEVIGKKVLPFYVRVLGNQLYLVNNCSANQAISNGSEILSINGKSSYQIITALLPRIAADGYIDTRRRRLLERYFNYSFNGFDYYYHLHLDRSDSFQVKYIDFRLKKVKTATLKGISIDQRKATLRQRYQIDEERWSKTPSPAFRINEANDYGVLTI